ncbi:EAL domain-containing protein [Rossellomorea vietnamensis]|uniref:EAL domain-containing protein n=1 Tax=Rossellomorea vietnamensis TaxID=218284 RepID=A0A5D4NSH8_9BACI|nr:EAL-associated domain-containing protein [Rossellomorea vietnamensis]TYS15742.1 EAL domain-containing protein [Rossellomorea vietnamensis]
MDPLEVIANLNKAFPYFQPVFSADEHTIMGYEILGRYQSDQGIISLGPFFLDEDIPDEYRIEADNYILSQALEKSLNEGISTSFFVNRDANLLMADRGQSLLELLLRFCSKGLDLERIVLEISEKTFRGDFEQLFHLIQYYKTYGIKIAIDNIGGDSDQWERLAKVSPDIMKVDLQHLRKEAGNTAFHNILYSLSMLARKIGSTLLFENIELDYQLHFAWKNGGRYYQGFYLQEPSADFLKKEILREKLKTKCQEYIEHEKRHLKAVHGLAQLLQRETNEHINQLKKQMNDLDSLIISLSKFVGDKFFRLYICDGNGFQLTENLIRKDSRWAALDGFKGKNWSWRPYFLENIMRMQNKNAGLLSDSYSDIETGEMIRTFSYPLGENHYLFMDLAYDFLYDQDGIHY